MKQFIAKNAESVQMKILICSLFISFACFAEQESPPVKTTNNAIKVMIVDTGVDILHPKLLPFFDLQDVLNHQGECGDDHGHGTHIAGLVLYGPMDFFWKKEDFDAAKLCPQIKISSCRYFNNKQLDEANKNLGEAQKALEVARKSHDSNGQSKAEEDVHKWEKKLNLIDRTVSCFNRAIDEGYDVVIYASVGESSSKEEYATLLKMKKNNILLITSAGNEHIDLRKHPRFPASYAFGYKEYAPLTNIIPIAATKDGKELTNYSNYGPKMATEVSVGERSTLPNGGFGIMHGTSQSAAIYLHKLLKIECEKFNKLKDF